MRQLWRVGWYRFRSTFAQRWGGLLAIVVLLGVVGGVAMGAVAGARRTQSSFPAYLAHANARNLGLLTGIYDPQLGFSAAYDPGVVRKIARLPHVRQVAAFTIVNPNFIAIGSPKFHPAPGQAPPTIGGSLDGEYSTLDRMTLTSGRRADPNRVVEVVMSAGAARELGMHLGSVLRSAFYTNAQLQQDACCSADGSGTIKPHLEVSLKLVGIVVLHTEVIQDDVDALHDDWVLLTPALMRELVRCCSYVTETGVTVDGGHSNAAVVQAEAARALPSLRRIGGSGAGDQTSVEVGKAERAIEPESIALGAFGGIAAIAALLIAGQMIGSQLRLGADERAVLRALGASPAMTISDGLFGVVAAVVVGALLASLVAVAISPLTLLGPVRRVEHPGIAVDWTVLGIGLVALIVVLSAVALASASRQAPHRIGRASRAVRRGSRAGRAAEKAGLPISAVTGVRFALDSGASARAVPVRSAIIGAVLAIAVLTSTVTFGTSLRALVSHPSLYGWNWNYEMLSGYSGQEDLPQQQVTTLLDHDPYISAWSGIYFSGAQIDGKVVPAIGMDPHTAVTPSLLTGHSFNRANEVVLGAATLAELHKHVGDTVSVRVRNGKPATLRIVGTATLPAIGASGSHTTMGTGAVLAYQLIPPQFRNMQQNSVPGPNAVLIRIRKNANPIAALHSLGQITNTINKSPESPAGGVTGVLRPAEIVNYRSLGRTPALLGAALAVGAVAALALTLIASVRRRRRELALLKTLGFTRRQLAAVVAWQSTIAVAIGVLIGVPVGIITGRALWDLFAHAIYAVPQPTLPALTITLIAIGALILANLVAAIPGRQAARTPTAFLLHAE